jgi:hypothetical protein
MRADARAPVGNKFPPTGSAAIRYNTFQHRSPDDNPGIALLRYRRSFANNCAVRHSHGLCGRDARAPVGNKFPPTGSAAIRYNTFQHRSPDDNPGITLLRYRRSFANNSAVQHLHGLCERTPALPSGINSLQQIAWQSRNKFPPTGSPAIEE